MDETGNVLMHKVGPLPLIAWVVGASGLVFIFLLVKGQSSANTAANNQTNSVDALSPNEAEAFGAIEQQQQDVTNALTTLGNNQSALGGSVSTLTGITTQQGAQNAASFQSVLDALSGVAAGQTSQSTAESNYYNSIIANLSNAANSLQGSLNGINSNVMGVSGQVNSLGQQVSGVGAAVNGVNNNLATYYAWLSGQNQGLQQNMATYYQWLTQQNQGAAQNAQTYYQWLAQQVAGSKS